MSTVMHQCSVWVATHHLRNAALYCLQNSDGWREKLRLCFHRSWGKLDFMLKARLSSYLMIRRHSEAPVEQDQGGSFRKQDPENFKSPSEQCCLPPSKDSEKSIGPGFWHVYSLELSNLFSWVYLRTTSGATAAPRRPHTSISRLINARRVHPHKTRIFLKGWLCLNVDVLQATQGLCRPLTAGF